MFQDWENIPDFLISECSLDANTFEYFDALGELDEKTAEAFGIYYDQINRWPQNRDEIQDQLESFRESYQGYFGDSSHGASLAYTYQYVEDTGLLYGMPAQLERYFDYESFARDLFIDGYSEYEGHIFSDY